MAGKVLMLWGLFFCGLCMAAEEKESALGTLEHMQAELEGIKQRDPDRNVALPEPPVPSSPVFRCARGVYSYDCSAPAPVMRVDTNVIPAPSRMPYCRNYLTPGMRCD